MMYHIVYVGCGLSGRRTSLATVMRASGVAVDPLLIKGEEENNFMYTKSNRQYHVIATISIFRAWLYYEHPEDRASDKEIFCEIDRLCMCDGIVFVIDSQVPRKEHNLWQFEKLKRDLASRGVDIDTKPIVFQANKRDLDNICSMEWVRENFRTQRCDYVESIAAQGIGTREALDTLIDLIEQ